MHPTRLEKTIQKMKEMTLDRLLVSDPVSIAYLTGIAISPGERLLVLELSPSERPRLHLNRLFPLNAAEEVELVWHSDTEDPVGLLAGVLAPGMRIGIDKTWPARFLLRLQTLQPEARYVNGSLAVDAVRMCKDVAEQDRMRKASALNDQAMAQLQALIPQELSEHEMTEALKAIYTRLGTACSFDPIVCYGPNAADPHHEGGNARPKAGDSIILDIGCKADGYCSDMTRTRFYKEASPEARTVHALVLKANLAAIAAVKPGARFCDIDRAARSVIEEAGYGPYFTHRTGHSIGLEVHDYGDVSSVNEEVLKPGMIFSIEPGIYLEGKLGVRIEDLVLVTEEGCEVLNRLPKDLAIVG